MNIHRFPNKIWWKIAFSLFLTGLLFLARDSMFTTAIIGFYKAQFLMLGLIGLVGVVFLVVNRRQLVSIFTDLRMVLMALVAAILLLPMVAKQDWQLMYFSVLLCVLLGIFLTYFLDASQVANYYVGILTVLAAYSVLAAYGLRRGVDSGLYRVPVFYNSMDFKFHNFFLSIVPDTYVKDRNFGIFREPGVYQFFLLLGLYLNNDRVVWEHSWQMWLVNAILAVTMVTTFATGGVIEMGLLAVVLFFEKKWYRSRRMRLAVAAAVTAGIALVVVCISRKNSLYWSVYDMFYGKFLNGNETGSDRVMSLVLNLRLFAGSPFVGKPLAQVLYALENNTSSTTILLAGFGILAGVLHGLSWLALVWKRERCWIWNVCYFGILMMSFNTQNLIADVFLWLLPMMALTESVLPRMGKKKGAANGS